MMMMVITVTVRVTAMLTMLVMAIFDDVGDGNVDDVDISEVLVLVHDADVVLLIVL